MVSVEINKPMYGTYVGIYDKWVKEAIRKGEMLKITITDIGMAIHDPKEWVKTGKVMRKPMRYANRPMRLICNYVAIELPKNVPQDKQLGLWSLNNKGGEI